MSGHGELVPGIDLDRLLRAIAVVETAGGRNNVPRFEVSYMPAGWAAEVQGRLLVGTGRNFSPIARARWDKWGVWTSASLGPWQILYHTAANLSYLGAPWYLVEPGTSEQYVVGRLRSIARGGATTIRQFADAWNSGSWRDANEVPAYTAAVEAAYAKAA
jgi:hypothetical protein